LSVGLYRKTEKGVSFLPTQVYNFNDLSRVTAVNPTEFQIIPFKLPKDKDKLEYKNISNIEFQVKETLPGISEAKNADDKSGNWKTIGWCQRTAPYSILFTPQYMKDFENQKLNVIRMFVLSMMIIKHKKSISEE
jgi:hypothetical protein